MVSYKYLGRDERIRSYLPIFIHSFSPYYKQAPTVYEKGIFIHHLILTLKGEGMAEVGKNSKILHPGDIFFYRADVPVKYYGTTDDFYTCFLTFNGLASTPLLDFYNFPDHLVFNNDKISSQLIKICEAADSGTREELLSSRLYALINDIGLHINSDRLPKSFEKAVSFIRSNYYRDLPVSEIAEYSKISESLLYKQFRNFAGTTPIAFINSIRIDWAKLFLETRPELSVAEIAKDVGFTSTSYFIECFKKSEGITPLKFRKDIQK